MGILNKSRQMESLMTDREWEGDLVNSRGERISSLVFSCNYF